MSLSAPQADVLVIWTVYDHPKDYPVGFIARQYLSNGLGEAIASPLTVTGATLAEIRGRLPPGLYRIPRDASDDPVIVESWL